MTTAYALSPQAWEHTPSQWIQIIPFFDAAEHAFDRAWLLSAADMVAKLNALTDNWDEEGSPRIRPEIVTKAVEVLCKLSSAIEPMSHACPVPGGGLQLEWQLPDRYLEIEVFPDGSVEYLRRTSGTDPEEGSLSLTDTGTVRELIGFLSHR